jgi:predicted DNA-binding protein (MmcQ/YjbR family)
VSPPSAAIPAFGRWRQGDQKLRASVHFEASFWLTWATGNTASTNEEILELQISMNQIKAGGLTKRRRTEYEREPQGPQTKLKDSHLHTHK